MDLEHFLRAREYLSQQGLRPALVMGTSVSENDINAVDADTDFPMPAELRRFYLEMGDGFQFIPDTDPRSDLVSWERIDLSQHRICNLGFGQEIEREAMSEIGKARPRTDLMLLRREME